MPIFYSRVTGIGELAGEFFEAGMLVIFGEDAPPELREVAVIHGPGTFEREVSVGSTVYLAGQPFQVTAVGAVANRNLKELGHAVVKFNGLTSPELPGDLCVEAKPAPLLKVGDEIRIEG